MNVRVELAPGVEAAIGELTVGLNRVADAIGLAGAVTEETRADLRRLADGLERLLAEPLHRVP